MKHIKLLLVIVITLSTLVFSGCKPVNLTTSVTPNGGGTVSPSSGEFDSGTKITLVATPAKYYSFNGWAGEVSGNTNPMTIKMDSNKNIVASFTKITHLLDLSVNIPGGGTIDPKSGTYEAGSQLKVTATPATGYRFVNWGGGATGTTNQISILMDKDIAITANFIKQYKLTVSTDPISGKVSSSGGIYDSGTAVNLTATPEFPYKFSNWVGADNNNTNPTIVTMNADKSVSATFIQLPKKMSDTKTGHTQGTGTVPMELKQFEWVEGTITCGATNFKCHVYIQAPDGTNIKDFGTIYQGNFRVQASVSGKYSVIVVANGMNAWGTDWSVTYTVYGLP